MRSHLTTAPLPIGRRVARWGPGTQLVVVFVAPDGVVVVEVFRLVALLRRHHGDGVGSDEIGARPGLTFQRAEGVRRGEVRGGDTEGADEIEDLVLVDLPPLLVAFD